MPQWVMPRSRSHQTRLIPARIRPYPLSPADVFSNTYGVLVPLLARKIHPLLQRKLPSLSYESCKEVIHNMFVKLHYKDVVTLLRLLDSVDLESDAEREARDKLVMIRTSMELRFASTGHGSRIIEDKQDES